MAVKVLFSAVLAACISFGLAATPGRAAPDEAACEQVRTACKDAGYLRGSGEVGSRLVKDCVEPLLNGRTKDNASTLTLPTVDVAILTACKGGPLGKSKTIVAAADVNAEAPAAPLALTAGGPKRANIIFVLADDFSMNLIAETDGVLANSMPNLARMQREGATFSNYFVTNSLCCPSRSSIFTGKLPHNSGVMTNTAPDGGYAGFVANGNEPETFAAALFKLSYRTAMMGKFLNGYAPETDGIPEGWTEWAVAGNAYRNVNYLFNEDGKMVKHPEYLTDKLSALGVDFIRASAGNPFFLELATFAPHSPYTPPDRYKSLYPDLTYPRTAAFAARPDANAPEWLQRVPVMDDADKAEMDEIFRKRVRSDKAIDDMIGAARDEIAALGLTGDTYVIFTSDNGYHLGEFSMRPGKRTPFDFDTNVPLVIVGPGVPPGIRIDDFAMNIDFYPTFLEWAGAPATTTFDGRSLAGLLRGETGPWRQMAVIEHAKNVPNADDPDKASLKAGEPPDYIALRLPGALYVEYSNNSDGVGYYDLVADPDALHNIAGTLPAARLARLKAMAAENASCKGAAACWAAQSLTP